MDFAYGSSRGVSLAAIMRPRRQTISLRRARVYMRLVTDSFLPLSLRRASIALTNL